MYLLRTTCDYCGRRMGRGIWPSWRLSRGFLERWQVDLGGWQILARNEYHNRAFIWRQQLLESSCNRHWDLWFRPTKSFSRIRFWDNLFLGLGYSLQQCLTEFCALYVHDDAWTEETCMLGFCNELCCVFAMPNRFPTELINPNFVLSVGSSSRNYSIF